MTETIGMTSEAGPDEDGRSPSFWRKVGWLTIGQTLERGGQVAGAILLVRLLSPENWNHVALALTVYLAAVTVGSLNLEQSVLFYLPRLEVTDQRMMVVRSSRLLLAIGSTIGLIVALWGRSSDLVGGDRAAMWLGLAIALEMPTVIAGPALILRSRAMASGAWDGIHAVIQLSAIVIPAAVGHGAAGVMAGLAVANGCRLVSYVLMFPEVLLGTRSHAHRGLMRQQLLFCAPLGLALAVGSLARVVDKWVIAWDRPWEIGLYAVAAQEIPILSVLPYAGGATIAVVLVERLHNTEYDKAHRLWFDQAKAMCRSVIPVSILVVALAPELVHGVFGPRYSSAVTPLRLFSIIGIHRVTEYGVVLRAAGRNRDVVAASLVLLSLNITLGVPGVLMGGLLGLTLATVVAFGVSWWWILGRIGSVFGRSRVAVFPWSAWLSNVAYYGCAGVISCLLASGFSPSPLSTTVKLISFAMAVAIREKDVIFPRRRMVNV